jgi:hypothetical protein
MSLATCLLYIIEGWIGDRKTLRDYIDLISSTWRPTKYIGPEEIFLYYYINLMFWSYLSIYLNIWYLIRLKVVISKEKNFGGWFQIWPLDGDGVFFFFWDFFFFCMSETARHRNTSQPFSEGKNNNSEWHLAFGKRTPHL